MKQLARKFYQHWMTQGMQAWSDADLANSAIVFSPHPDDETLGCGGTIIRKKKVGAAVKIVIMTDGCRSHRHLISEQELREIRGREAIAAAHILGVESQDILLLGFTDSELANFQDLALKKVMDMLLHYQPQQVLIPYSYETPSDHAAVHKIVLTALKKIHSSATIYEYPIWFWHHWPWVGLGKGRREIATILKESVLSSMRACLFRYFQSSVDIQDVLALKQRALAQYKSQIERLIPEVPWQTLGDVSNGEFLERFFQPQEFFRRYSLADKSSIIECE
ncbi:MAG: PIG-L family deacetylase [Leptolyngbyaceae bacterium]|nr:PIG-L family deacetylase [Leptolyngbyaceae bacterium]